MKNVMFAMVVCVLVGCDSQGGSCPISDIDAGMSDSSVEKSFMWNVFLNPLNPNGREYRLDMFTVDDSSAITKTINIKTAQLGFFSMQCFEEGSGTPYATFQGPTNEYVSFHNFIAPRVAPSKLISCYFTPYQMSDGSYLPPIHIYDLDITWE